MWNMEYRTQNIEDRRKKGYFQLLHSVFYILNSVFYILLILTPVINQLVLP